MDLKEIKRLIAIVQDADISHFSIEEEGTKIEIKKQNEIIQTASPVPTAIIPQHAPAIQSNINATQSTIESPKESENLTEDTSGLTPITAQMVGTFYTSSSPEAPSFVKVGDPIKKGQVICIIEAMKLFNEIESEVDGVIEKVCVSNGDTVEFGQVLFLIK